MYWYKSKVGTFTIRSTLNGYGLFLGGDLVGEYDSPTAAADDVFTHTTGEFRWDRLDGRVNPPSDLSEWHQS